MGQWGWLQCLHCHGVAEGGTLCGGLCGDERTKRGVSVVMWRDAGGHVLMLRDYEHRLVLIIELTGVV